MKKFYEIIKKVFNSRNIIVSIVSSFILTFFCLKTVFSYGFLVPNNYSYILKYLFFNIFFLFSINFLGLYCLLSKKNIFKNTGIVYFGCLLLVIIRALQRFAAISINHFPFFVQLIISLLLLILILLCLIYQKKIVYSFFFILIPFSIYTIYFLGYEFFSHQKNKENCFDQTFLANNKKRIIWVVFDECDKQMIYDLRPQRIELDQFDEMQKNTFFATNTYQVDKETIRSMPSFFLGKKISNSNHFSTILSNKEILLFTINGEKQSLSKDNTIFSKAYDRGYDIGIIGWYLPYGNLFDKYIHFSKELLQFDYYFEKHKAHSYIGFNIYLFKLFFSALSPNVIQKRFNNFSIYKEDYIEKNLVLNDHCNDLISNEKYNFILFHCPLPHSPGIFDEKTKQYGFSDKCSYYGNMLAANEILKQIRENIEKSGQKEKTYLFVTSDHWLRINQDKPSVFITEEILELSKKRKGELVPFIIEIPGQEKGLQYDKPFDAIVLHDLLLAIMDDKIHTYQDIADFIDKNGKVYN